ncbi:MAG: beta-ketoacyl synthase chain length factor [Methylococcaceae bacterium]|nr:beta-ketoacyl synthase chain length factor [Methylococcaceae bacterium]
MDAFRAPASSAGGQETRLSFTLEHWCLWRSELASTTGCWPGGEILPCNGGQADVSFMPLIQRRRLSPLAMAACAVAWRCRQLGGDMPAVFYSSHGESQYYFEMLDGMAQGERLSPTRFSLSVHNAIAGQFGIHAESHLPYMCLAGGTEGLFAAFLEAAGMQLEVPKVMVVFYEQPLPEVWQPYLAASKTTWALAMVMARGCESGNQLNLIREPAGDTAEAESGEPSLIRAILSGQRSGGCRLERSNWRWSLGDA